MESILFTSDCIYFNESERLTIEADIIAAPLKKDVEFKTKETLKSSLYEKMPILRIPKSSLEFIRSELTKYKKRSDGKIQKRSDNAIRVEDGQLVFYYHHDGERVRIETGLEYYFANDENHAYAFSDRALYLFLWLARSTVCDEAVLLPRENYCLIEGHTSNMVIKVRTMLKNDILDKIV